MQEFQLYVIRAQVRLSLDLSNYQQTQAKNLTCWLCSEETSLVFSVHENPQIGFEKSSLGGLWPAGPTEGVCINQGLLLSGVTHVSSTLWPLCWFDCATCMVPFVPHSFVTCSFWAQLNLEVNISCRLSFGRGFAGGRDWRSVCDLVGPAPVCPGWVCCRWRKHYSLPLRLLRSQMVAFVQSVELLRFRLSMPFMPGVRTCQQRWELVGAACSSAKQRFVRLVRLTLEWCWRF